MKVPLNEILGVVGRGVGILSDKLQRFMHSGKIADFWEWVDKKWYRSTMHDPRHD
ncbi:MAG: hypothetical protein GX241_01790 [Ruminococcaceae bacterium]|nr:hypothetical protein [Oscillospiraceae bacterium]